MAISSDAQNNTTTMSTTATTTSTEAKVMSPILENNENKKERSAPACDLPPKSSIDTSQPSHAGSAGDADSPTEFSGDVNTNNDIPSQELVKKVENYTLLDGEGRAIQFKDLYSGPNVARRVLVIFIRHFFCGVWPLP